MKSVLSLLLLLNFFTNIASAQLPKIRTGKHLLTLQWIGAEKPGMVLIENKGKGMYSIKGEQRNAAGEYLTVEGSIQVIGPKEIRFEGLIESKVAHINGGQPCRRTGIQVFKATGTRKYWRLQKMINCEGGMVTDYIDIYF